MFSQAPYYVIGTTNIQLFGVYTLDKIYVMHRENIVHKRCGVNPRTKRQRYPAVCAVDVSEPPSSPLSA